MGSSSSIANNKLVKPNWATELYKHTKLPLNICELINTFRGPSGILDYTIYGKDIVHGTTTGVNTINYIAIYENNIYVDTELGLLNVRDKEFKIDSSDVYTKVINDNLFIFRYPASITITKKDNNGVNSTNTVFRNIQSYNVYNNKIFLVSRESNGVLIYDTTTNELREIYINRSKIFTPDYGIQYTYCSIAVYNDKLFVSEVCTRCINVYDIIDGKFLYSFGKTGNSRFSRLGKQCTIAIGNDELFVADIIINHIYVFNADNGQFLRKWGKKGSKPGQFKKIRNIVVDNNKVYIADSGNKCVHVFR